MKNRILRFLVNPFEEVPSLTLFMVGVTAYVISSILAFYTGMHFQGVLSVKSGANLSLMWSFYNNGVAIILLTALSFVFARVRNQHVRLIDVLNVVLMSRIIIYVILLLLVDPFFIKDILIKVELAILDNDMTLQTLSGGDKFVLLLFGFGSLAALVYFFYFFTKGLRFVINSKSNLDVIWILFLIFGLEIVFVLFPININ